MEWRLWWSKVSKIYVCFYHREFDDIMLCLYVQITNELCCAVSLYYFVQAKMATATLSMNS